MYKCWWRCAYQAYSVCRPDKVLTPPSGTFEEKNASCHHPSGVRSLWLPVFTGCLPVGYHRYFLYLACGRALWYSLQASIVGFQPICRAGEFCRAFSRQLLSPTPSGRRLIQRAGHILAACWSPLFFAPPVDYVVRGGRFLSDADAAALCRRARVAAVLWFSCLTRGGVNAHFMANSAMTGTARKTAVRRCSGGILRQSGSRLVTAFYSSLPRCQFPLAGGSGGHWQRRADSSFLRLLPLIAPVGFFLLVVSTVCSTPFRHLPGDRRRARQPAGSTSHHDADL